MNDERLKIKLNGMTIGRNKAASLVGGLSHLNRLIDEGRIHEVQPKVKGQNTKWHLNFYEVLSCV